MLGFYKLHTYIRKLCEYYINIHLYNTTICVMESHKNKLNNVGKLIIIMLAIVYSEGH